MISGGHATVFVSNMDNAVRFYTDVLGLKLTNRFGNHWATVLAGKTLIGLHPWSEKYPRPGTKGSVQLGFVVSQDESIQAFAARLRKQGVTVSDVLAAPESNYVFFEDPDGNPIYVGDWYPDYDVPHAPREAEAVGSMKG